jgi:hypothetical protein
MARELEASFSEEYKSYSSLGRLSSHSENVHSSEVEEGKDFRVYILVLELCMGRPILSNMVA